MPRIGISFDQVAAIADKMVAENINPTIKNVTERLGTGSGNTIHKHLTMWKEARPRPVVVMPELPALVINALNREIERAKGEARAELEDRLVLSQADAAELAACGETIEADLDKRTEELHATITHCNKLLSQVKDQATVIEQLTRENERERYGFDQARIEVAESRINLNMQTEKISELTSTIDTLMSDKSIAIRSQIEADKMVAVLSTKLETADERINIQAEKLAILSTQIDQLKSEYSAETQARSIAEREAAVLSTKLDFEIEKSRRLFLENGALDAQAKADRQSCEAAHIAAIKASNDLEIQSVFLAEKILTNTELTVICEFEKTTRIDAEKQIAVLVARLEGQEHSFRYQEIMQLPE